MYFPMSYKEYVRQSEKKDCRETWVEWRVRWWGMSYRDANKISFDKSGWGYEQPKKITPIQHLMKRM